MVKIILSAPTRYAAIVDGMDGTMMIAAETTRTAAIIFPCRYTVKDNIAHRTFFGATSTMNTHVAVDGKLLVADHETVEVGTYDVAHGPGCNA